MEIYDLIALVHFFVVGTFHSSYKKNSKRITSERVKERDRGKARVRKRKREGEKR